MVDKSSSVLAYIAKNGWLPGAVRCSFLAAGEYNENYRVSSGRNEYVFRINHGTQLGLANQIEYEFMVLETVYPSGVTPRPYRCSLDGADLGKGVLLMEYISGRQLQYGDDLGTAARIFARIHAQPANPRLIVQKDPLSALAAESLALIQRQSSRQYENVRSMLLDYRETIMDLAGKAPTLYGDEPLCLVNTEVNSGNFLINPDRSCLVDWEKAVLSCRYQDLAHFLVPTTTLWKSDCRLDDRQKNDFLSSYREALGSDIPLAELEEKTRIMERAILLRALSWCYMAYHEYVGGRRVLRSDSTFQKIVSYLDEARCFLQ